MLKKNWLIFLLAFISCFSYSTVILAALSVSIPPGKKPINVGVGLYVDDIISLNETTETLTFEGILTQQWKDPRLAFKAQNSKTKIFLNSAAESEIDKIWHPQIHFLHLHGTKYIDSTKLGILQNGQVSYSQRFQATINNPMDFKKFPFDSQVMRFSLASFTSGANEVKLIPLKNYQGFSNNAHLDGWHVSAPSVMIKAVNDVFLAEPFSQYSLSINYHRIPIYYIFQIIIPLLLIVFFSFTVFWMVEASLLNGIGVVLTALLTIVVFQWRVFYSLPHLSYQTFFDSFMLCSFIVVGMVIGALVLLDALKNDLHKRRLIVISRWLFPLIYFIGIICVAWVFKIP